MPPSLRQNLKQRILRHTLIKPEDKQKLLKALPKWDAKALTAFEAFLTQLDAALHAQLNRALADEKKRKKVFHHLSQIKVKTAHGKK